MLLSFAICLSSKTTWKYNFNYYIMPPARRKTIAMLGNIVLYIIMLFRKHIKHNRLGDFRLIKPGDIESQIFHRKAHTTTIRFCHEASSSAIDHWRWNYIAWWKSLWLWSPDMHHGIIEQSNSQTVSPPRLFVSMAYDVGGILNPFVDLHAVCKRIRFGDLNPSW